MMHRLKLALLLVPLALTLAVLIDSPFHALSHAELVGVFRVVGRPVLSAEGVWSGRYQADLETWLEQDLSLKAAMVRSDNSLNLALFGDISGHTNIPVVLGRHHTLFELNYINNYNGVSDSKGDPPPRSPYSVEESARLMGRAARAFRLIGVDFMVVFYPSKASALSQRVRPKYLLPGGVERAQSGYEHLLQALRSQGVSVVDGAAVFSAVAHRDPRFPLYNSGGTHWTDAGACEVAKQVVGQMPSNVEGARLVCSLGERATAVGADADLAELINLWDNSRFLDQLPELTASLSGALPGGPRDALVVGTSFSEHLIRELRQAGVFRNVSRFSYYRHSDADAINWRRDVQSRRAVILEQWQWSFLTVNTSEFLDDLAVRDHRFAKALREVDAAPVGAGLR